jgi:hypothetical protein
MAFSRVVLPAAGRPHQADDLACGKPQGDVLEDRAAVVAAGERFKRDDRVMA